MILEEKEEAYQYAREVEGASKEEAEEFAQFSVGFHPSFNLEQRYLSYKMATQGPAQTAMDIKEYG